MIRAYRTFRKRPFLGEFQEIFHWKIPAIVRQNEGVKIIRNPIEFKSMLKSYLHSNLSATTNCTRLLCHACHFNFNLSIRGQVSLLPPERSSAAVFTEPEIVGRLKLSHFIDLGTDYLLTKIWSATCFSLQGISSPRSGLRAQRIPCLPPPTAACPHRWRRLQWIEPRPVS
jgi:hypothetical protein